MMKLYYLPGACSMSVHIAAREAGIALDLVKVQNGKLPDGSAFAAVNPRGYVPALQLKDGTVLTETAALLQYVADLTPQAKLAPPAGTLGRTELQGWLAFISTELHKAFGPLWNPQTHESTVATSKANLAKRFAELNTLLGKQTYLMGDAFSIADAYAFAVLGFARMLNVSLAEYPAINAYLGRIAARPQVQAAMRAEGLLPAA
jgi:glutathione S-transferase